MTDQQFETFVRAQLRQRLAAATAPSGLRYSVSTIPDTEPEPLRLLGSRRLLLLVAVGLLAALAISGAIAVGSGLIRLPVPPDVPSLASQEPWSYPPVVSNATELDLSVPGWWRSAQLGDACHVPVSRAIESVFGIEIRAEPMSPPDVPAQNSVCQYWTGPPDGETYVGNLHVYPPVRSSADLEQAAEELQVSPWREYSSGGRAMLISRCVPWQTAPPEPTPTPGQGGVIDTTCREGYVTLAHERYTLLVILGRYGVHMPEGEATVVEFGTAVLDELDAWLADP